MNPSAGTAAPSVAARRARVAVGLMFFANGIALTTVLPRLPEIKADLSLTNTALGLALAAAPVGSLTAVPLTGRLIARFGSAPVAAVAGLVLGLALPMLGIAPAWAALAGTYLVLGAADGVMDAAMNAHGLRVQKQYGRSLINGMHGLWSLGAATGAAIGTLCAALRVPLQLQLLGVAAIVLAAAGAATAWRMRGPDPADLNDEPTDAPLEDPAAHSSPQQAGGVWRAVRPLAWVGLLGVLAGIPEDVANAWSTLYLVEGRDAPPGLAGLGYTTFAAAMLLSRFSADRVTDRFGTVTVARFGGLLAFAGYVVVLSSPVLWLSIAGFALVGLGIAPAFPTLFHASGHWPGVRSGDGVTVLSWVARLGFLVTPPLVGLIADNAGIGTGLWVGAAAALAYALLAGRLAPAVRQPAPA
ncbi:MAG: MFS transporter [Jiangellales bacterium]